MTLHDTWADWLGPAFETITSEQLARLDDVASAIDDRWPDGDPDHAEDRTAALSAATQVILGDDTLESLVAPYVAAVRLIATSQGTVAGALLASSTGARSGPGSEADLIARSGVSRMTVRKALGK